MGLIVCKFGGTSLADRARLDAVSRIVRADPRRRIIVASAPGRRFPGDDKVTDLLIHHSLSRARSRLQQLTDACGAPLRIDLPDDADDSYLASRGEYCCARILAHLLGFAFVDAAGLICFDDAGALDPAKTAACIRRLDPNRPTVIPGFYGTLPDGHIRTLPRGGSDTTGALLAAALQAEVYENFTDVPGLLACDPRLIPDAKPVPFASYDEVRLLAHCGASVLHEDAVAPVQAAGVPIRLCSTFAPELPGTRISRRRSDRPMLAVQTEGNLSRCAVAGPLPSHLMPAILARFPGAAPNLSHCGVTFTLPLPPAEAARLLRKMLASAP